jgi:hypothetical protein
MYWQDIWRIKPSLTLTYGVNYGWQTAPTERLQRQSVQIDTATGQLQTSRDYLTQRDAISREGGIFNPGIGFLPVGKAGRGVFDVDWNNVAPRIAVAWNPPARRNSSPKCFRSRSTRGSRFPKTTPSA